MAPRALHREVVELLGGEIVERAVLGHFGRDSSISGDVDRTARPYRPPHGHDRTGPIAATALGGAPEAEPSLALDRPLPGAPGDRSRPADLGARPQQRPQRPEGADRADPEAGRGDAERRQRRLGP